MEGLMWLIFEAAVALLLLLFIVWWTWPRSDRGKRAPKEKHDKS